MSESVKISLAMLDRNRGRYLPGYVDELLSLSIMSDGKATIEKAKLDELNERYKPELKQPVKKKPCIHLGDEIDRVPCESCNGMVRLIVRTCAVHQRCTLAVKKIDGVVRCPCPDYQ